MKRKKIWRYYCEHCKKSGCSAYHIQKHERGCTNNPNRTCGMCGSSIPVEEHIKALGDGTDLELIRTQTANCPACILAAIRQSRLQYYDFDEEGSSGFHIEFDFKEEKEIWWENVNSANNEYGYIKL